MDHQQALGLNLTWEAIPGLTIKNSIFNGVASREWSRVFNFRPGHDGIMDIAQVIYKDADDDNLIGEYRAGIAYVDALQPGQIDKHQPRRIVTGWYEPPTEARRHLSKPLKRMGEEQPLGIILSRN